MRFLSLLAEATFVISALAQSSVSISPAPATTTASDYAVGNVTYNTNDAPSSLNTLFTYIQSGSTRTRTGSFISATIATSGNATISFSASSTPASTVLTGSIQPGTTSPSGTVTRNATSTATAIQATNTVPCNGHPEFCNRRYSNITQVAAHNSPFIVQNNLASNQALDVTTQLNDGVRMLQFQVHKPNETLYLCHSSCDLLNAGTLVTYLTTVREWLDNNQYDVVTILMGNYDVLAPTEFIGPIVDSGLINYAFTPATVPMARSGWPTLGEMILGNQRAVIMLDYEANQSEIPWLLDEFSYMWETPFSPTDRDFPCTADRPPNKDREVYEERMSLANHNLNLDVTLIGINLLVPAKTLLNETNAVNGYGSAGWAVQNCTRDWNRPPNFLMVDYYNIGNFNGSVFAVAAAANDVTYDRNSCCGAEQKNAGPQLSVSYGTVLLISVALSMEFFLV